MKLVALTLENAIQEYNAAATHKEKANIAMRWFERNAKPTLEEIEKKIEEAQA